MVVASRSTSPTLAAAVVAVEATAEAMVVVATAVEEDTLVVEDTLEVADTVASKVVAMAEEEDTAVEATVAAATAVLPSTKLYDCVVAFIKFLSVLLVAVSLNDG